MTAMGRKLKIKKTKSQSQEQHGKCLIKKKNQRNLGRYASHRHTGDDDKAPVISVTENTSLEEFIADAKAARRSFETERGKVWLINRQKAAANKVGGEGSGSSLTRISEGSEYNEDDSDDEDDSSVGMSQSSDVDEENIDDEEFSFIPKKPKWTADMSGEEYQTLEQDSFLRWKRRLNIMTSSYSGKSEHHLLPPFEKNLEFWRQLWKMVEMSDVVVQVVDARDPLFYHSADLDAYCTELNSSSEKEEGSGRKVNLLLLNKADMLTLKQREMWADYFKKEANLKTVFFSATETVDDDANENAVDEPEHSYMDFNSPHIFSPPQLLNLLSRSFAAQKPDRLLTVGFLGYPNVGKSSTINCFLTNRRLQVSATPGKTKHYQTHVLNNEVVLVDGPGLVIPNLKMSKASMVAAGILPIDNLTDYRSCLASILQCLPFPYIQKFYGITNFAVEQAAKAEQRRLPTVLATENDDDKNASIENSNALASSYAMMRGLMKPGSMPDTARAARIILKDFTCGKLLFCHAPPSCVSRDEYFKVHEVNENDGTSGRLEGIGNDTDDGLSLAETFPEMALSSNSVHIKSCVANSKGHTTRVKAKKEKLRRIFG